MPPGGSRATCALSVTESFGVHLKLIDTKEYILERNRLPVKCVGQGLHRLQTCTAIPESGTPEAVSLVEYRQRLSR